ncbi:MAG: hypothetical protein C4290_09495 [Chloroflexota bacterium]
MEVRQVLLAERRAGRSGSRHRDPLSLEEVAAVHYPTAHAVAAHGFDAQLDLPVGEEDAPTRSGQAWQLDMRSAQALGGAGDGPCGDLHGGAGHELDGPAAFQRANAHLRALKIQQDRGGPAQGRGRASDARQRPTVLRMGAVRHVQAGHVHPRLKQALDRLFICRGRADGADDFRPPETVARSVHQIDPPCVPAQ